MSKRLKASFAVNTEKVLERAKNYPYISKVIQPQLNKLKKYNQPPLIEQVHEVIYWLNRYAYKSKRLLNEIERIISRINGTEIKNKTNLLDRFGRAKDRSNFNSSYSELFLANFFIKYNFNLIEFEPKTNFGRNKVDFKLVLDKKKVFIELKTPSQPSGDFEGVANFLFGKLERIQSGGLVVEITGFESYDSSTLWQNRVEPPTHKQIEEIITKFRKHCYNVIDEELPKELPTLCINYPKIQITITKRIPNMNDTFVALGSSRTAEGFPIARIVDLILDEREHFSSTTKNFLFIDFSRWSHIYRHYLDSQYYREILIGELRKRISLRINGVFTYIVGNQQNESLENRRILYLNLNKPFLNNTETHNFLKFWESAN